MNNPFFEFFNKNRPFIDLDSSKWPNEWRKITWKAYSRFPHFYLPKPKLNETKLEKAIVERETRRDFGEGKMSESEISDILFFSCGLTRHPNENLDNSKRAQPSGGARYPIEIYPLVFKDIGHIKKGLYHYNVLEHSLEKLPEEDTEKLKSAFVFPWSRNGSVIILFSFMESRSKIKYGNLAYKLGLIEAGHISQNIYLVCSALNLKCCALGGLNSEVVNNSLDLDGIAETVFYSLVIGR